MGGEIEEIGVRLATKLGEKGIKSEINFKKKQKKKKTIKAEINTGRRSNEIKTEKTVQIKTYWTRAGTRETG